MKEIDMEEVYGTQPLMVFAAEKYYIKPIMKDGISHFYRFKRSKENADKVLVVPDGCVDIVFSLDEKGCEKAFCYGSPLTLTDINYVPFVKTSREVFGVRLLPGNTIMPGGYSISDFTNKEVNLSKILGEDNDLIEKICRCDDFEEQTRIFTTYYLEEYRKRVLEVKKSNLSFYIINEIVKSKGTLKIEEISEETGYSTRYINKLFNETFGMSPKHFSKIIRFQGVLKALIQNKNLIDITESFGFCDQSHLNKEFKKFLGTSPKKFSETINNEEYIKRLSIIE